MAEDLRKLGLYLRSPKAYHVASELDATLAVQTAPLGRYYLDQTVPLDFGHWNKFDEDGLPWHASRGGEGFVHDHNTLSGYALAHWDYYLLTSDESHLETVIECTEYTLATVDRSDDGLWKLRNEPRPGVGHVGTVSGLDHGQWMSLLARLWQVSRDERYLDLALRLVRLFEVPMSEGGSFNYIDTGKQIPWFEEAEVDPDFHILNGMQLILWGLLDLATVSGDEKARSLWELGVDSLEKALPMFDMGYWSWYGVSHLKPSYVASMKYHGLHIVALEILAEQTGSTEMQRYAELFSRYASSPVKRFRSGVELAVGKKRRNALRARSRNS